jgi:lysophospholipase L1-like esterase
VHLAFPGVTLHLKVKASFVALNLQVVRVAGFDYSVDGGPFKTVLLKEGQERIELLKGETMGEHNIEVVRRTESWQGNVKIRSLELDDAGQLLPVARPSKRLEFIGDSITCGSGVESSPSGETADPIRSNARLSFGKRIAKALGAECHLVSYGGRGVIRDWQGIRATNNAPQFYELTLPDDPATPWNFRRFVPDVIGICLGQNDFNQGIPDENEFVNAYVEFVRKVHRDAPRAVIFLMDSPMLLDEPGQVPKRTVSAAYIDEVVSRVGSPLVRRINLPHFPGSKGDPHPTAESHEAMTAFLIPYFRDALSVSRPRPEAEPSAACADCPRPRVPA